MRTIVAIAAALGVAGVAQSEDRLSAEDCLYVALRYATATESIDYGISEAVDEALQLQADRCKDRGYWASIETDMPREHFIALMQFELAIAEEKQRASEAKTLQLACELAADRDDVSQDVRDFCGL